MFCNVLKRSCMGLHHNVMEPNGLHGGMFNAVQMWFKVVHRRLEVQWCDNRGWKIIVLYLIVIVLLWVLLKWNTLTSFHFQGKNTFYCLHFYLPLQSTCYKSRYLFFFHLDNDSRLYVSGMGSLTFYLNFRLKHPVTYINVVKTIKNRASLAETRWPASTRWRMTRDFSSFLLIALLCSIMPVLICLLVFPTYCLLHRHVIK